MPALTLKGIDKEDWGIKVTYEAYGYEASGRGLGYYCDAVFRVTKDGRVTATLEAVGDGMPSQPDIKAARKKLAAYCRWLSVALNKNDKPLGNIPVF